jgi:predicted phosphate transport protein (TIGR00153 family)
MDTIGKKITHITPSRGFAAEFGAATTVLIFSMPFLAVPISTTHTLVGAVVGVGLAGGAGAVDFRVFGKIAASWVASLPIAGAGAVVFVILFAGTPMNVAIVTLVAIAATGAIVMRPDKKEEQKSEAAVDTTPYDTLDSTPFDMFYDHAKAVEKTVEHMLAAVTAASKGKDASKYISKTISAELDADNIKTDLRNHIGTGVRIAIGRDTFLHMLSRQDRIADYAQNVAEQISFRELMDDDKARKNLKMMAESVHLTVQKYSETVDQLNILTQSGFAPKQKVALNDLILQVNLLEHEADECESTAAAYVFSEGDDKPLAAMHMYRILQRLDDVANAAEKAANAFLPMINK